MVLALYTEHEQRECGIYLLCGHGNVKTSCQFTSINFTRISHFSSCAMIRLIYRSLLHAGATYFWEHNCLTYTATSVTLIRLISHWCNWRFETSHMQSGAWNQLHMILHSEVINWEVSCLVSCQQGWHCCYVMIIECKKRREYWVHPYNSKNFNLRAFTAAKELPQNDRKFQSFIKWAKKTLLK